MKYVAILLTVGCLVAAGCESQPPKVAVAVAEPELISPYAPAAPAVAIRGTDGRESTLQAAAQPVYVVAFVHAADSSGCGFNPELAQMADNLEQYSVSVVQVTELGGSGSSAGPRPISCPPPVRNRILLLDPDGVARRAFGSPQIGTLMVVDHRGDIVHTGTMDGSMTVYYGARAAADQFQREQQDLNFDWYGGQIGYPFDR